MEAAWLRKQSGQAVVLVAVAVLVLTAILALALDGGGIYLDKRQLQNAADSAALAGAELLMAVQPSYTNIHNQAIGNLVQNLPGTSKGAPCSSSCPNNKTIGLPGGNGVGTLDLGAGYYAELSVPTSYTYQVSVWHVHPVAVAPIHGFQSTITLAARATAQNANLPYAIVLLQDKPAYAQWSNFSINGSPGSITMQGGGGAGNRGGMFSNASIAPGNGTPSIIFSPGGNQGDLWAVNESAADRAALNAAGAVQGQHTPNPIPLAGADLGVIIEITPANNSGTTTCNKHIFSAASTSTIELTPSPQYFNISIYIETMPNWQTTCTSAPLGTNVLKFSGGSCYSILGALYGPADNMTLTGSACGSGVGQIVAWTLTVNGNGNVNETFDPSKLPYMKGLTQ